MAAIIGALRAELSATIAQFQADMGKAADEVSAFGKRAGRVGRDLTAAGRSMTVGVTLPILGFGAAALNAGADFEAAMNAVKISSGATADEMGKLRAEARRIGKDTVYSAEEAAQAMDMLSKNGLDVTEILGGAAKATTDLAAATGAQLEPAAAAVTDTMNLFHKGTQDLPAVVNTITGAVNESKFAFDDFQLGMAQAGGVAAASGMSFMDFAATLAATSSQFASGSDAGTSFKTFLSSLVPKSKDAAAAMKQYGLEFFNANGSMKSMGEIAQLLQDKLGGLNVEARNTALREIFGADAWRTAVGLMEQGAAGLDSVRKKIEETNAAAQAAQRMAGFRGELEKMKGAFQDLAIAIGDSGLLGAATGLIKGLTGIIDRVSELNPAILKWGMILAGIAAVAGPILLFIGSLATGLASLITILPILSAAFGALWVAITGPIGLVVVAVLGLIAVWVLFGDKIKAVASAAAKWIAGIYTAAKTWLQQKLAGLLSWVGKKVVGFIEPFKKLYDAVVGHSWVPDMVDGVLGEFDRLDKDGNKKVANATAAIGEKFADLKDRVNKSLDDIRLPEAVERANALRARLKDIENDASTAGVGLGQFAGAIAEITTRINALEAEGLTKEAAKFRDEVAKTAREVRTYAQGDLPPLEKALQEVDDRYGALKDKITAAIEENRALADVNAQAKEAMATLEGQLLALEKAHDSVTAAAKAQYEAEKGLADLQAQRQAAGLQQSIQDLQQARGDGGFMTKAQADLQAQERALSQQRLDALIQLRDLEAQKAEAERVGDTAAMERLTTLVDLAGQLYGELENTTALQIEATRRVREIEQRAVDDISNELADMVLDWKFDLDGLRDIFKQIAKDMWVKPFMEGLTGSLMKGFGGFFASGGTLKKGQWGIAGERGPEPIVAKSGDLEVIPNGHRGGMGGVVQNFNIGRMDRDTFNMTRRQFARTAKEALA